MLFLVNMNYIFGIVAIIFVAATHAQFENGFVKILEDQRYQDGANFGNFRNQEDGIKYKEETNALGVRTGFWEYPDENGKLVRVEFEAGPGIGFRIINSNIVDPTPIARKTVQPELLLQAPVQRSEPKPVVKAQPKQVQPVQQPVVQPRQQAPIPIPLIRQPTNIIVARQPEPTPGPINIFDYPADLQFFRDAGGHRFKFKAV